MNEENTVHLGNVLSVFDGMSCGQVALGRAGITYDNYYASEIDKYAIKITQKNHPNTIQLGSIVDWKKWNLPKIDIFMGGSPCQGFSNAGLGLNFDDPRSKLFFTYVDILFDLIDKNPKLLFLLENVKMKKEWRDIITDLMGVEPIEINSALVSAQNRKRLYWTNIPNVQQPEDRFIFLKDIIEDGEVDRDKSYTVDANYFKGGNPRSYFEDGKRQLVFEHQSQKRAMVKTVPHGYIQEKEEEMDKYPSLCAQDPSSKHLIQGAAIRNQVTKRGVEEQLNIRKDEKSNCVVPSCPHKLNGLVQVGMANDINGLDVVRRIYSDVGKSQTLTDMQGGHRQPKVAIVPEATKKGYVEIFPNEGVDLSFPKSTTRRGRRMEDKCNALQTQTGTKAQDLNWYNGFTYRKLTPLECERLQTLNDNYTEGVSNTQRYKMIGNGWTIEVIAHIFRNIKVAQPLNT